MKKVLIIHEEKSELTAKYYHPKSCDFLNYSTSIRIKDSGKNPVELALKFNGIYPFAAPMPPEEHTLKAASISELCSKVAKWFKKYGYELY